MLYTRKHNRLSGFDYSSNGLYFITLCTKDRVNILWKDMYSYDAFQCGDIKLSEYGDVVKTGIENISAYHPSVWVDNYVIMPNHIHIILCLQNDDVCVGSGRTLCAPTISLVVKQMKEYVTKSLGFSIWQKSFHDHIIRNAKSYQEISRYINNNPIMWEEDCFYIKEEM